MENERAGVAAGVPYLAVPPPAGTVEPALVVVLHMMDPPRTEAAMASALRLSDLRAWRVYLGLPMTGSRMPDGGLDTIMRLGMDDALMNLIVPITELAAEELPHAVEALVKELDLADPSIALVGGSAGAAAVLLALAETSVPADAVVLVNPAVRATSVIEAGERVFGMSYEWNDERRSRADQLDFVIRANEIAARDPQPAVLIVQGESDAGTFVSSSAELHDALAESYRVASDVMLVRISGLAHALADEPGVEAKPQTAHAAAVDAVVRDMLARHLA